jgi:hypothetical protein
MNISHSIVRRSSEKRRQRLAGKDLRVTLTPPGIGVLLIVLVGSASLAGTAHAVPSFARQTNLGCSACHTNYPQLNAFGRNFKLRGYSLQSGDVALYKRLSGMLQPSFTRTAKDQAGGAAPHFDPNDNFALTQGSIFYGGRLLDGYDKLGGFVQVTYDGVGRDLSWDLVDFRWADSGSLAGKPLTWGVDLNNAPSVQDLWNTSPIWGYPFSGSGLAPGPSAATLISDPLAGTSAGLGAFADWNNTLYGEVTLYKTLGSGFLKVVGIDDVDQEIKGVAPYWRLALRRTSGPHNVELGTFGLYARAYPGRDRSAGKTDRYVDAGVDLQYEYAGQGRDVVARAAWIHEDQRLDASSLLGGSSNRSNRLNTLALSVSYLYDQTYGVNVGYNHISGTGDAALYGGSPDSDYYTLQLDWLPLNKNSGPGSRYSTFNPKISLQYTAYTKLDGVGSGESDNNTLYLQAWLTL